MTTVTRINYEAIVEAARKDREKALVAIADAEDAMCETRVESIAHRLKYRTDRTANAINGLRDRHLVEITNLSRTEGNRYRLTAAGWAMTGRDPKWGWIAKRA